MSDKAMTPERLAEIKARLEAATPGPWMQNTFGVTTTVPGANGYQGSYITEWVKPADKAFIVHAPEDIRALLAEVERLESQLAEARAADIQWVTWDGSQGTTPELGRELLLTRHDSEVNAAFLQERRGLAYSWTLPMTGDSFSLHYGDRWAYLPTPPEVK